MNLCRHPCKSGDLVLKPSVVIKLKPWIPAFSGMTMNLCRHPCESGELAMRLSVDIKLKPWIPAFAGMTEGDILLSSLHLYRHILAL
ncbi:Uncharacterised protein [Pragia fontium]|nr:Uncharacterised protein [Pragia fontium]